MSLPSFCNSAWHSEVATPSEYAPQICRCDCTRRTAGPHQAANRTAAYEPKINRTHRNKEYPCPLPDPVNDGCCSPPRACGNRGVLTACTGNDDDSSGSEQGSTAVSNNDEPGEEVVIGFSGPEADHGWLAAVNDSAIAEAEKYDDIELRVAEGPTTPTSRSVRSKPSSTTTLMRLCCCLPMGMP